MVTFNPALDLESVLSSGANCDMILTAYFKVNVDSGPLGDEARKRTYQEFPQFFVYNQSTRRWKCRQQGFALG